MTDPLPPEQLERIARLQARRTGDVRQPANSRPANAPVDMTTTETASAPRRTTSSQRQRRRHPALGSRIAAAGLGATSMFAIVGLFGIRDRAAQNADAQPVPPSQAMPEVVVPPVKVVIHRVPASTTTKVETQPESTVPAAPIELTANTIVRTVTVTEAPRRRSSSGGSSGGGGGGGAAPAPAPQPKSNGSSGGSK